MHWPVVGRGGELASIRRLLADPDCFGVLLVGSAGVGKTRLSREIPQLSGTDGTASWLMATPATRAIPLGALAHLLPTDLPASADRLELLRRIQEAAAAATAEAGGVLVVDDAHLLDDLSAAVVQQLAQDGSVFVALTIREGEQLPRPLVSLWSSGVLERLEIGPLDRAAVDELVETVLTGPAAGRTKHQLWRLSAGNPLFLRELILGARETGVLYEHEGVWRHEGSLGGFARIREVMEARLGQLTAEERDAVEVLALAEPLPLRFLEEAIGTPAVEHLERRHIAEVRQDDRRVMVRLAHPLYGEVVREALPQIRARRISRRLADLLEGCGYRRREDLLQLASWRLESGSASDPEVLLAGARQAHVVFDHNLAERLAVAARDLGGGFEASLSLAEAIGAQGRLEEAEQLMADLAGRADTDLELTRAVLARSNLLVFQRGDLQVLDLLEQSAEQVASADCRDELEAMLTFAASYLGELPRAIEGGRRFLSRNDPNPGALVRVLVVYTYARALMVQYTGLADEIERGVELARDHPEAFPIGEHLLKVNWGFALRASGRLVEAESMVRDRYEQAVTEDAREVQGLWATQLAHTLEMRGHAQDAVRFYNEAVSLLEDRDPVGMRLLVFSLAASGSALLGDRRRATELLARYHDHAEGRVPAFGTAWNHRAQAWLTYLDGDLRGAAEKARQAGEIGTDENVLFYAAMAFHDAARFGHPEMVTEPLSEMEANTEGELIPALATHAQSLSERDPHQVEEAAATFDRMGADLYAAEATSQAAYLHKQAGRTSRYGRLRARAAHLAEPCSGVATPWLWHSRPPQLTQREYEIAVIAARGLTNREISDRLHISPRTVGNHLASAYSKLGASGRHELATLLDVDPI